jgi:hypothetical protein
VGWKARTAPRSCRLFQRRRHDLVRIGKSGLLPRHRAHADALLDAGIAFLYDAVLERPALFARQLEIQVCAVHRRTQYQPEGLLHPADIQAGGRKNALANKRKRVKREGFGGN